MTSASHLTQRITSALIAAIAWAAVPAWGDIIPTGDVSPADPSTWTNSTYAFIGSTSAGSVTVNAGSTLRCSLIYLGGNSYMGGGSASSVGTLLVDGEGASLSTGAILIGEDVGAGILNIANGGKVTAGTIFMAQSLAAASNINFSNGGTLTTQSLVGVTSQITGSGTINTQGLVSDVDLIFDASHGLNQSLLLASSGSHVTMNLDLSGASGPAGLLGAGYRGTGSLTIRDGIKITSAGAWIGYQTGSAGTTTVSGAGSTWTINDDVQLGSSGSGSLNVTNGGKVIVSSRYPFDPPSAVMCIGFTPTGTGTLTVDGTASSVTHSGELQVGSRGNGVLNIYNGASVTVGTSVIVADGDSATGTINFGANGGTLTAGSLYASASQITGSGTVNTHGIVSDTDLLFDATHGSTRSLAWNVGSANVTVNFAVSGTASDLGVGYLGAASMAIQQGVKITSGVGYLGYKKGSSGTATISGVGSSWVPSGIIVGNSGFGMLNLNTGANLTTAAINLMLGYFYAGYYKDGVGTAIVDGVHTSLTCGHMQIGWSGTGILTIINGATVSSGDSSIGDLKGSAGTATVDGTGSMWTLGNLNVGESGTGVLNITNGALVTAGRMYVAMNSTAVGSINFGPAGGTLTSYIAYVSPSQVTGTGTINTSGLVSDVDWLFDATHPLTKTTTWTGAGQHVTVNYDTTRTSSASDFGVGYAGVGNLAIRDGVVFNTGNGFLGYKEGSTGIANVAGAGSNWIIGGSLTIGNSGTGTLMIANGGSASTVYNLNNVPTYLGYNPGAAGTLAVDGSGSTWTNVGNRCYFYVGYSGTGTLAVNNGGKANSYYSYLGFKRGATGTATVDGPGSTWNIGENLLVGYSGTGTLNITNGGIVSVAVDTIVAHTNTAVGSINFGSNGGTLTTGTLYATPAQVSGTGTINMKGIVADSSILFDATHGPKQSLAWAGGNANVTLQLDLISGVGVLGAGYQEAGTLTMRDGASIQTYYGYLGYNASSAGAATVDGAGSNWTCLYLYAGYSGVGNLVITNGGKANLSIFYLGYNAGAMGTVTLDGAGSVLTGNSGDIYLGYSGYGTLNVTNGATASNRVGYLGHLKGATGIATIDGAGSQWTMSSNSVGCFIGESGNGTLNITRGGSVSSPVSYLGYNSGATGRVTVDGIGSAWTNSGNLYVGYSASGMLAVSHGASASASSSYLGYASGVMGAATIDGTNSKWTDSGALYVGYSGFGTLNITNGGSVSASTSYLGYSTGATGASRVDGANSKWTQSGALYVGYSGSGSLTIANGGSVSASTCYLGYAAGATGSATIDGTSSNWTNSSNLYVGSSGAGSLTITSGAKVTAAGVSINSQSLVAISVGKLTALDVGTGSFTNNGVLRLNVIPGSSAGTYTPIVAGSWAGTGSVQAFGGSWNSTTHKLNVIFSLSANAGKAANFNRFQLQRVVITDPTSGKIMHAAFAPTTTDTYVSFTASLLSAPELEPLDSILPAGAVLSGWNFTVLGIPGSSIFLSLPIGPNLDPGTLALYHFDGTAWSPYSAPDLSYDGTYANFTVTSFSGYAVTTSVPEPAALVLLALGGIPLVLRRRWGTCRRNCSVRTTT